MVPRSHSPVSASRTMTPERTRWMLSEVEKIRRSPSSFPLPNSKVRKRLTDEDSEAETIENMATMPPTTLYMP